MLCTLQFVHKFVNSFFIFFLLDKNCDRVPTLLISPVGSASSGSQSDVSQACSPPDIEVFDFSVHNNLETLDSGKKKKERPSSLSRFFTRGKQRKSLVFSPVVRGKYMWKRKSFCLMHMSDICNNGGQIRKSLFPGFLCHPFMGSEGEERYVLYVSGLTFKMLNCFTYHPVSILLLYFVFVIVTVSFAI